jgi:uncharacterized protein (TIGR03546 family)
MTIFLKQLFSLFNLLNSDDGEKQIAFGLVLGLILGFSPFFSIQSFLLILAFFIFRIQFGAALIAAFFFKFVAFLVDPLADKIGRFILETESLRGVFTSMYHMPILPYTRFNNSIVMGSFFVAAVLMIPMYFIFIALIRRYRTAIVERFKSSKLWKMWKATTVYKLYTQYESLMG